MSHYKEHRLSYLSSRLLSVPAFVKIASVMHNVYSRITGTSLSPIQKPVVQLEMSKSKVSRHEAIINLLNRGKNYDTAERIVDVTTDWDLNLDFLDASSIDVKGNSVWIDLED